MTAFGKLGVNWRPQPNALNEGAVRVVRVWPTSGGWALCRLSCRLHHAGQSHEQELQRANSINPAFSPCISPLAPPTSHLPPIRSKRQKWRRRCRLLRLFARANELLRKRLQRIEFAGRRAHRTGQVLQHRPARFHVLLPIWNDPDSVTIGFEDTSRWDCHAPEPIFA